MPLRITATVLLACCALLTTGASHADPPVAKKPPVVVDAAGNQLGPVIGMSEYLDRAYVLISASGIEFPVAVSTSDFLAPTANAAFNIGTIYYQSRDCSGQPYLDNVGQRIAGTWVAIDRGFVYAPVSGAPTETLILLGQRPSSLPLPPYYCEPTNKIRTVVPAFVLIDLNSAFTPPFRIVAN